MKKEMRAAAVAVFMGCLCTGCAEMQDAIVRGLLTDYGYRREILPVLMDGYERKMESLNPSAKPAIPAPVSLDQG